MKEAGFPFHPDQQVNFGIIPFSAVQIENQLHTPEFCADSFHPQIKQFAFQLQDTADELFLNPNCWSKFSASIMYPSKREAISTKDSYCDTWKNGGDIYIRVQKSSSSEPISFLVDGFDFDFSTFWAIRYFFLRYRGWK